MKIVLAVLAVLTLNGCATAYKMNRINIGMTKAEVIRALGKPVSVGGTAEAQFLDYNFYETSDSAFAAKGTQYFIRLIDGKVESFGRVGDFINIKK